MLISLFVKGEVLVVWEQRRTPVSSELLLTVFDFNIFSFLVRKVSPDAEMTYDIEKCLISNQSVSSCVADSS